LQQLEIQNGITGRLRKALAQKSHQLDRLYDNCYGKDRRGVWES